MLAKTETYDYYLVQSNEEWEINQSAKRAHLRCIHLITPLLFISANTDVLRTPFSVFQFYYFVFGYIQSYSLAITLQNAQFRIKTVERKTTTTTTTSTNRIRIKNCWDGLPAVTRLTLFV